MDSLNRTVQTNNRPLTFWLRPSARYHNLPNGKAALVLRFPLRAVFIHEIWHPALACLANNASVALEQITAATPHIPPQKIEFFLNTLIRKGYVPRKDSPCSMKPTIRRCRSSYRSEIDRRKLPPASAL